MPLTGVAQSNTLADAAAVVLAKAFQAMHKEVRSAGAVVVVETVSRLHGDSHVLVPKAASPAHVK